MRRRDIDNRSTERPGWTMELSQPFSSARMAVLVNSSDGFADCWPPFFTLLSKYWPNCPFPVYLNTEALPYSHPGMEVRSLRHPPTSAGLRVPWSDRLLASLDVIPEQYVLYMQEDYFLNSPVRNDIVADCLRVVSEEAVGCVHLTPFGARRSDVTAERPYLADVPRVSRYRVSTQAAIWDKSVLASYVRPKETVWETEILGTMRSWVRYAGIRSIDPSRLQGGPVVSYTGTGIIRGKWHPAFPFGGGVFLNFPFFLVTRGRLGPGPPRGADACSGSSFWNVNPTIHLRRISIAHFWIASPATSVSE